VLPLGLKCVKQLAGCPSARQSGVRGASGALAWPRRTARAEALLGSGLAPGFRETLAVPDMVVRAVLLATFPASLW